VLRVKNTPKKEGIFAATFALDLLIERCGAPPRLLDEPTGARYPFAGPLR